MTNIQNYIPISSYKLKEDAKENIRKFSKNMLEKIKKDLIPKPFDENKKSSWITEDYIIFYDTKEILVIKKE